MNFPGEALKGIKHQDKLYLDDGELRPKTDLFYFEVKNLRDDNWIEQSINWNDDSNAIPFTLSQRKDNGLRFKAGLAVLPLTEIERVMNSPFIQNKLDYERGKDTNYPENKYHGNLLLLGSTGKQLMIQIAASLALGVSKIISQSNQPLIELLA